MKNLIRVLCIVLIVISCSKDSGSYTAEMGDFTYTVSGAASKTITGTNARFGQAGGSGLAERTFITMTVDSEELIINIVMEPPVTGTFVVNPMAVMNDAGQITIIQIEERDSWAELGIGSTFTNDRRAFDTASANGGSVTITSVNGNIMIGNFNMSLMELLGGDDPFNNPKISVQGTFRAVKQ